MSVCALVLPCLCVNLNPTFTKAGVVKDDGYDVHRMVSLHTPLCLAYFAEVRRWNGSIWFANLITFDRNDQKTNVWFEIEATTRFRWSVIFAVVPASPHVFHFFSNIHAAYWSEDLVANYWKSVAGIPIRNACFLQVDLPVTTANLVTSSQCCHGDLRTNMKRKPVLKRDCADR